MWGTIDGGVHDADRVAELGGVGVGDALDASDMQRSGSKNL
jgi:hypothetical protein